MSLLDGYQQQNEQETTSLLDGYEPKTEQKTTSLLDGYQSPKNQVNTNENNTNPNLMHNGLSDNYDNPHFLTGGVNKNIRTYESRFPDRNKNFFSNAAKDVSDTVKGLAQIVGNGIYYTVGRPLIRTFKGEKPIQKQDFIDAGNTLKNTPEFLNNLKEGLKENYGQGGIDIISDKGFKFDPAGFAQSFYAHPLNLLDIVGIGEVGKLKPVAAATKGGEASKFSKAIGNKAVSPKYSENLVYNAGQRLAETKPIQNIVNAIDNSPIRPLTDIGADFLGLSPDSRLMGTHGANVRQAKMIDMQNQAKNIAERNKAIALNKENLSGLTDLESKELVKSIETGKNIPMTDKMTDIKSLLRDKVKENSDYYVNKGLLKQETVKELPVNTYAAQKFNKRIDDLTSAEKLNALEDIIKMPAEQRPFYVPIMYDDNLRASDFFANNTKVFRPSELKHRASGLGLEKNTRGANRVYDPVEISNRLDAHRIKLENTEKMINEITENFAKPLDLSKEQVMDGYVPFNPDSFLKFYRSSIDLNDLTMRKIQELGNIDTAMKEALEQAVKDLPEDVKTYMGVTKNNKIYQIPKEVAETLGYGKDKKGVAGMLWDMGTAGFKRKVLGTSPKWFINNRIGNGIMAAFRGVLPQDYIKALSKNLEKYFPDEMKNKSMYEAEKTIIGRTGGSDNNLFGNTARLLGGEFLDTSELKGIQKASGQIANGLALPGKTINAITDAMFNFNQKFEDWERKAVYIHHANDLSKKIMKTTGQNITKQEELLKYVTDNPKLLEEVMKEVDTTLGDYSTMTAFERRNIRRIVPFYSWMRTITRYTLSLPESNPFRANILNKVSNIMYTEDEDLAEYQRGSIPTEFTSSVTGRPLRLNYEHSVPFSTFAETGDNPIGILSPFITKPYEDMNGIRNFMNKPFVSPNFENIYNGGYASLRPDDLGEQYQTLPTGEKIKALGVDLARTTVPLFDWTERVGAGTLMNLINKNEFKPFDALYDTSFGGYNYNDGFYKRPKGWTNEEQILRLLLPLQQQSPTRGKIKKLKRLPK